MLAGGVEFISYFLRIRVIYWLFFDMPKSQKEIKTKYPWDI